ncbi:lycopene beta-cyclase CrtY [Falsirhodobacter sp. alg1]|uniref:lycopene beta-cyclase CrtY n=1 Tax=Falsirhodobacter sp. alg1 TaxID=1472418 RepID=UPI0005EEA06B|nr:lycopene beta-cyclase CrtY [Falsirhodobacter sp. alg1]
MQTQIAIAGAGLAAALTALRLLSRPDCPSVILADPAPLTGRTWSFHEHDISASDREWLAPAVAYQWAGQDVRFPGNIRSLRAGYATITPTSMAGALRHPQLTMMQARVQSLSPDHMLLDDGTRIDTRCVIDARGIVAHPAMDIAFQKFLGQEVELDAPHGLTRPIIMDATVDQVDGYRFVYVLPFGPNRLLIEDTRYSDTATLSAEGVRAAIGEYANSQGWTITRILAEEQGALPLMLGFDPKAFWADAHLPRIGMRAAQFHPVTGYSLPDAVRTSAVVEAHWHKGSDALAHAIRQDALSRTTRFYRLLNRMLFRAADPAQRRHVMNRFYRLPEPLIERFYAGRTTPADMARILIGKPPVPIRRALRALPERISDV